MAGSLEALIGGGDRHTGDYVNHTNRLFAGRTDSRLVKSYLDLEYSEGRDCAGVDKTWIQRFLSETVLPEISKDKQRK